MLDKVDRRHLPQRIINAAGRDDERRLLAREQSLRRSIRVGKILPTCAIWSIQSLSTGGT
jgi:hypothetical protein